MEEEIAGEGEGSRKSKSDSYRIKSQKFKAGRGRLRGWPLFYRVDCPDGIFEMYSVFLKVEELGDFLPEDRKKELKEEFSDIHYHGQRISKLKENEIVLAEALNWLDTANNDKNNGFYVGIVNDTWRTPKTLTRLNMKRKEIMPWP